ncbi:MAG: MerR family transcriptional regulator [Candidatus Promineifilaceae bacterium]|nr:MerR family transcriptional regulator [Candidatus Promineifilaceae bacterium]
MPRSRHTPIFNMKAVVQETGLKPDTLRAWERRYDLPKPDRTEGGHRIYSQRDIDTLKWLVARQEEGLSISHAVDLWNRLEEQGQDPLLVESATTPVAERPPAPVISSGESVATFRQEWLAACLDFDERRAEEILAQAFALYPPEQVCFEVLQKGLVEIGKGWYEGQTTVQQEHFASELANRRLKALIAGTPAPTRPGRILVACPPEEEHTFGPLLLTLLLRRRGWEVLFLGANVPLDRLEATLASTRPQLVIFSAQQLHTAATLMDVAQVMKDQNVPMAYGGRIFNLLPDLRKRIAGHFLGEGLETTAQVVESVLTTPQEAPSAIMPDESYREALVHFRNQQAAVENKVWQQMSDEGVPYEHLTTANMNVARNIKAGLKLGGMAYLGSEIQWLVGLLANFHIPPEWLTEYLEAYRGAAEEELDERGQPLKAWLAQLELE